MEDGLAQLAQNILRGARKVRGQDFDGRLLFEHAQRLWLFKYGFGFQARHAQTHLYGCVSSLQYLRDFTWVVTMKETEDENAGGARCLFARANEMANMT